MGTYVYTLRAKTVNVNVDGRFQPVHHFDYAFREPPYGREYPGWARGLLVRAQNLYERLGRRPQLVLWNEHVYLSDRSAFFDTGEPGICIGRVVKVKNRWHCIAQETTVDLAMASLGYNLPDAEKAYAV